MLSISEDYFVSLVETVVAAGLKAKAEVGVQFGAAGASTPEALKKEPRRDLASAARLASRCLEAGAGMIMLESEGGTEGVDVWAAEVPGALASAVGLRNVMFEAADPVVFEWYAKQFGPDVNLFGDHTHIAQMATMRTGLWGTLSRGSGGGQSLYVFFAAPESPEVEAMRQLGRQAVGGAAQHRRATPDRGVHAIPASPQTREQRA